MKEKISFLVFATFLFSLLTGSAILLSPTSSSLTNVSPASQLAQVSGSTYGSYPTAIKNPANFHPGYYKSVGKSSGPQSSSAVSDIANNPAFAGIKVNYSWEDLEPREGEYDFSVIAADIALAKSYGKRFMFGIGMTQFNGNLSPEIPSYMWQDPKYGCGPQYYGTYPRSSGGWLPCYWNMNLQAKYAALLQALGVRFNNEPYLEAVNPMGETAVSASDVKAAPGYSSLGVENAFKNALLAAKQAFPDKVITQHINFGVFDLVPFAAWLAQNGIGIGNPDIIFNNSTLTSTIYPLQAQYHDVSPTAPEIQWGNWIENTVQSGDLNVSESMIKFVIANNNPWYLVIRDRGPYFKNEVIPAATKYPLPAAAQFYAGGGGTTGGGTTTTTCSTYLPNSTPPSGFGASYNLFTTARELLLSAICNTTNTVSLTSGNAANTTYIWNQAYYTRNGQTWNPITLTGSNTAGNGQWIIGTAQTTQPLTTTEQTTQNYYASYVCTYQTNTWKCGCSDSTCATPKWNLQGMRR